MSLTFQGTGYVQLVGGELTLGGGLPYERGWDACQKFWIKILKETNLGVAQPIFDP